MPPQDDVLGFAVPLELDSADGDLRLITTITSFATAADVTLAELQLEAFLPADDRTAEALRRGRGGDDRRRPGDRRHAPSFLRGAGARRGALPGRPHRLRRLLRRRDDHGLRLPQRRAGGARGLRARQVPPARPSDMRYRWVCVRLNAIDDDELREFLVDAWRMCVPKKVAAAYEG